MAKKDNRNPSEIIKGLSGKIDVDWREDQSKIEAFFRFTNRFHKYSAFNRMLILAQKPNATVCGSYTTWKQVGRSPATGTGIKIFSPAPRKITLTDKNGKAILNEDGSEKTREYMSYSSRFSTFDISDTNGEELPDFSPEISGSTPEDLIAVIDRIAQALKIDFKSTPSVSGMSTDGKTGNIPENISSEKIVMEKLSAMALILQDGDERATNEKLWVARAAAYATATRYGLETSGYIRSYLPLITNEKNLPTLLVRSAKLSEEIEALDLGAPAGWASIWSS